MISPLTIITEIQFLHLGEWVQGEKKSWAMMKVMLSTADNFPPAWFSSFSMWLGVCAICPSATFRTTIMRHWFLELCWKSDKRNIPCFAKEIHEGLKTRETAYIYLAQVRNIALGQTQTGFSCQNILYKCFLPVGNKIKQMWRSRDKW